MAGPGATPAGTIPTAVAVVGALGLTPPSASAASTMVAASAATGRTVDPCALVTKAEAEAAVGVTFAETNTTRGAQAPSGFGAACEFDGANPTDPALTLIVRTSADFQADKKITTQQWFALFQRSAEAQAVPGVADGAYWTPKLQMMDAVKGDVGLEVFLTTVGKPHDFSVDTAGTLIKKAASRL